ncbi:hypothetical protein AG0111_0g10866 [Alternaria gaisen]|uniref:Uncharacterized protein n=1 Tax=Alternaria gaisen TaxID=167740 RepID=A0ACB6F9P5_9PLEO|nr:hypothetical protein AG0111_0g10866 [Alternaria gaisen]
MHKTNLIAILAAAVNGVTAIDKIAHKAEKCISYAVTDSSWAENDLRRRRVVYDTTGLIPHYDQTLYSIGWMWSNEKKACNAQAVDTIVYYNGIIIPGGTYVIESSEELNEDGDRAYQCLLEVFKVTLGNNLNCTAV